MRLAILAGLAVSLIAAIAMPWLLPHLLHCRLLRRKYSACIRIGPEVWKRPDALIYDQSWMAGLGLDVTWDNPDIWILQAGNRVSGQLDGNTDYTIVAQVWNGSFEAPAFNVIVDFYVRDYGAGAIPQPIGSTTIPFIQVRGSPPAIAKLNWRTPQEGGHYCILVRLRCVDDAVPGNNEGQENVEIVKAQAGHSVDLQLPIHNPVDRNLDILIDASAYRLAPADVVIQRSKKLDSQLRMPTNVEQHVKQSGQKLVTDRAFRRNLKARVNAVTSQNQRGMSPVPDDWRIKLPQGKLVIPATSSRTETVTLYLPLTLKPGTYPITLNARMENGVLYGGVTALVEVS